MILVLKLLHIAAVVLFLGNIVTGLFWHAHAARTRDPHLLAHAMAGIIRSDRLFTLPGVIAIVGAGVALAMIERLPMLRTGWIAWTIALLVVSGIVFMARVAPLQRELLATATEGARTGDFDFARYRARALAWEAWGAVALLTPVAGLVLMVVKPGS